MPSNPATISTETMSVLLNSAEAPRLEFAYVDESGDRGAQGSQTYTLGCVLVPADNWTDRLDLLVDMRREISATYGVRQRDEIKANYLLRGRGPLKNLQLGDGQRRDIYQRHFRLAVLIASGVFAVVIRKDLIRTGKDPAEVAWEYLLQRLRLRSQTTQVPIMLIHDEGDDDRIRALHRRFRRRSWAASGEAVPAPLLIEDPVARVSANSYFVQMADLVAYAAYRHVVPPTGRAPGSVCNEQMWEALGTRVLSEVSHSRRDGIVVWPT